MNFTLQESHQRQCFHRDLHSVNKYPVTELRSLKEAGERSVHQRKGQEMRCEPFLSCPSHAIELLPWSTDKFVCCPEQFCPMLHVIDHLDHGDTYLFLPISVSVKQSPSTPLRWILFWTQSPSGGAEESPWTRSSNPRMVWEREGPWIPFENCSTVKVSLAPPLWPL